MLERKLTALACVAGILVFGACYGPAYDPRLRNTPPPIPGLDAHEIHSIRVTVKDGSESHRLDPSELARTGASNWRVRHTGVEIYAQSNASADAVLEIIVLSESTSQPLPSTLAGKKNVTVDLEVSAMLKIMDENVICRQSPTHISASCGITSGDATEVWNGPNLRKCVMDEISRELVYGMLSAMRKPQ